MDEILQIKQLTTGFKVGSTYQKVVHGTDFALRRGEVLGIVGESGSGKSVTALSLMRLLPQKYSQIRGEVLFFRRDVSEPVSLLDLSDRQMSDWRGRHISMIFQEPMTSLNPVFTCGAQVAETMIRHLRIPRAQARERTLQWFDRVLLDDPTRIWSSYPHQLSGGQKQRVMIAMALCCDPEVLIADEPTTALDVTVQQSILELIRALQKENQLSVLFISHDLGVISEMSDQILVMEKGEIVEQGDVHRLFASPQHPYTRGLIACRPLPDRKLTRLLTMSDFRDDPTKSVAERIREREISTIDIQEHRTRLYENSPLLRVEGLIARYPVKHGLFSPNRSWLTAVDNVRFEIYPGEIVGLVGESGSGKTTLGRSLMRLQPVSHGQIWLRDREMTALREEEWRPLSTKLQIIFQDPYASLNPRLSIGQALYEPLRILRRLSSTKAWEQVAAWMERVGLDLGYKDRFPHELSGGQRQRVCIARALCLEPELLICDEPVSALDVSVQAQVLNVLLDLRDQWHFSCLFISHDLSVVHAISDRILVMREGKLIETGYAEEVMAHPQHAYTRLLTQAIPGRSRGWQPGAGA